MGVCLLWLHITCLVKDYLWSVTTCLVKDYLFGQTLSVWARTTCLVMNYPFGHGWTTCLVRDYLFGRGLPVWSWTTCSVVGGLPVLSCTTCLVMGGLPVWSWTAYLVMDYLFGHGLLIVVRDLWIGLEVFLWSRTTDLSPAKSSLWLSWFSATAFRAHRLTVWRKPRIHSDVLAQMECPSAVVHTSHVSWK